METHDAPSPREARSSGNRGDGEDLDDGGRQRHNGGEIERSNFTC